MQLPGTGTGSSGLYQVVEEYTISALILPLTGTVLSQNPGIPVSGGNPSSYVRAVGCKTRENSNLLKKGKIVISVKIQNFYRSRITKRTSPLESSCEI